MKRKNRLAMTAPTQNTQNDDFIGNDDPTDSKQSDQSNSNEEGTTNETDR